MLIGSALQPQHQVLETARLAAGRFGSMVCVQLSTCRRVSTAVPYSLTGSPGPQAVALDIRGEHLIHAEQCREVLRLVHEAAAQAALVDLLQQHDVGLGGRDLTGDLLELQSVVADRRCGC